MYKILGKQINSGEFNGKPYENLVLYCERKQPSKNATLEGIQVEIIKIKTDVTFYYNECIVGNIINVFYDRFGNVADIRLS